MISKARSECDAPGCVAILLDGGDQFQGTPASNMGFGRPVVTVWNRLGRTASALGNHEFDWGQDTLRARMREARYPFLAANVTDAAELDRRTRMLIATVDPAKWPRAADAYRQLFESDLRERGGIRDRDRIFRWGAQMFVRGFASFPGFVTS